MTYTENGDRITLEMTRDDYEMLLMMAGFAAGASRERAHFYMWLKFVNRLNETNPNFMQYEIPEAFR